MQKRTILGIGLMAVGLTLGLVMQVVWENVVSPVKLFGTTTEEEINGELVDVTMAYAEPFIWPTAALPIAFIATGGLLLIWSRGI